MRSTEADYAARLSALERAWWKRLLPNPYRWNVRHTCIGAVLDVGCGIGRCLNYLGDRAVGVDPNEAAVEIARSRGCRAMTPTEFATGAERSFDTLLCSHVLEHLTVEESTDLVRTWLPCIRPGGRVVLICPQARGQASDPTHRTLMDANTLRDLCNALDIEISSIRSFPLPFGFGRWWVHNETVVVGRTSS